MSARRRGLALAGLCAVAALVWVAAPGAPERSSEVVTGASAPPETTRRHSYRLRLRATTEVALAGVDGRLDLDGRLTVTELGPDRYSARLGPMERATVTLLGRTAPAAALDGAAATVALDPDGGVAAIAFAPETSAVARSALRTALVEIGPFTVGEAAGTVERASMFGTGPLTETGGPERVRTRMGYAALSFAPEAGATTARGRWTLTVADGALASLTGGEVVTVRDGEETLAEGRSQIALTSVASEEVARAEAEREASGRVVDAPPTPMRSTARVALERRAAGMTTARLVADLAAYGDAGRMPRHDDWLWRASGWLLLHPEAADALVTAALSPERSAFARGLVADLLAGVGHAEAQAALRRLLDAPAVAEDPRWGELVQRFSLVQRPDAETLAWLGERLADGGARLAVATALGAAAGKVARGGDAEAGRAARAPLLEALAGAGEGERVAWIDALGNAGLPDDVEVFARWAASDEAGERAAAARALRKVGGDRAAGVLLGLVADPSAAVAREAARALGVQGVGERALTALAELVSAGAVREGAYGALVTLAARADGADTAALALLEAVVAADGAPADVRALAARKARDRSALAGR